MAYTLMSPQTCTVSETARIGEGAVIYPNNHIFGESVIGAGAVLHPNNIVENSEVGEGAHLTASVLSGAKVGKNARIGPFAYLRPGADVGENCRVGDFAEIKNAKLGAGTKVSHLAYVGDAEIGENCVIGAPQKAPVGGEWNIAVVGPEVKLERNSVVKEGEMKGGNK